jgi:hypothetical protein
MQSNQKGVETTKKTCSEPRAAPQLVPETRRRSLARVMIGISLGETKRIGQIDCDILLCAKTYSSVNATSARGLTIVVRNKNCNGA